ncbi:hypothetical protein SAMN05421734_101310 [Pelagirhabdus alkalitolerans]|uniref:Peptidase S9 prolyl oligopeptidase catalytic domain-containing protein n=1 Tax=Pelagirhabdus alkalitolerans TaxID=1612202 RepID=A0A1G6GN70_9BACI|nr:alpha/beta hydrolase [Pelagirhabdus alkalitolerans]SDB83437.1 hypothetical protein SAMN05421734_101310 [Pelagirhabdus alkalitolerans]
MNKKMKAALAIGLGTSAGLLITSGLYFYNQSVGLKKKIAHPDYDPINVVPNDPWKDEKEWFQSVDSEWMTVTSNDQLRLSGLFIPAKTESKKIAILAHGYNGNNKEMAPFSKLFHDLDFNLLLPDARGHGESEGDYIGFGWPERRDYLVWIDELISRFGASAEIILYGISMGGATVLNVSGEDLPTNVKAVISDCAFSSVSKELAHQLRTSYKLPPHPFIPMTSFITKLKAGYWFHEAAPVEQVKKSDTPTLIIHGDADDFVPTSMAYDLYEALNTSKQLYIVPGAKHTYSYVTDKRAYEETIEHFLDTHMARTVEF